jgi:hypothetical protein
MRSCHIDHIAVTAGSLKTGVEYVQNILGVELQQGGEHLQMGTHNYLLKLGDTVYLEVIAVNPHAKAPKRPRWFNLDHQPDNRPPRLATWIARTEDIRLTDEQCTIPLGKIESMSRGDLRWLITVPEDGSLPFDGVAPTLIEWHTPTHPASTLQDSGCSLVKLEGFHPEADKISEMLNSIGFAGDFSVHPLDAGTQPYRVAHIRTPSGIVQL